MIAISSLPISDLQHVTLKTTTVGGKHSDDHLLAYTAYNVKTLLECSKEKIYYQQKLLPTLSVFIKHVFYHCKLTPTILVIALIYLKRLKAALPSKSKGGKIYTLGKHIVANCKHRVWHAVQDVYCCGDFSLQVHWRYQCSRSFDLPTCISALSCQGN